MNILEESDDERKARAKAETHEYNCEKLLEWGEGALHVAPKFAPYFRAVCAALPVDVTENLRELKVMFLAVEKSLNGLHLDLPRTTHAHPPSDSHPVSHTHHGGQILYFSPLLFEESPELIHFTIAHEIAHAVLGHTGDFMPNALDTAVQQEREADEMAERWGFKRPLSVSTV